MSHSSINHKNIPTPLKIDELDDVDVESTLLDSPSKGYLINDVVLRSPNSTSFNNNKGLFGSLLSTPLSYSGKSSALDVTQVTSSKMVEELPLKTQLFWLGIWMIK